MYQNVWFRGWRCCNFAIAIKTPIRHAQNQDGRRRKFPLLKPGLSPTETPGFPYWKSEPHDGKKSPESLVVDDTWHIWHIILKTLRVPLRKHVRITILLKNASYLSLCPQLTKITHIHMLHNILKTFRVPARTHVRITFLRNNVYYVYLYQGVVFDGSIFLTENLAVWMFLIIFANWNQTP